MLGKCDGNVDVTTDGDDAIAKITIRIGHIELFSLAKCSLVVLNEYDRKEDWSMFMSVVGQQIFESIGRAAVLLSRDIQDGKVEL